MKVSFHPAARRELLKHRKWYRDRSLSAAVGFEREIDHAISRIAEAAVGPNGEAVLAPQPVAHVLREAAGRLERGQGEGYEDSEDGEQAPAVRSTVDRSTCVDVTWSP
jgi:plasmid stabilization system protein ParE